jgi:hypothetical protein
MDQGLREAAYWAGLRQEIYISLALQRAPNIKSSSRRLLIQEPLLVSADDCTWASRAVLHCADVLDFAFGSDEQSRSAILYKRLEEYNLRWRDCRPASFDPYFSEFREGESFPDLRFHTDWHGQNPCLQSKMMRCKADFDDSDGLSVSRTGSYSTRGIRS